jgi:hypothetical protein
MLQKFCYKLAHPLTGPWPALSLPADSVCLKKGGRKKPKNEVKAPVQLKI